MTTETQTTTERRAPLTRERVLEAAVELADRDGIEALSMRRLGTELGVEAMSLDNHVANKEDVLDGMMDVSLGEIDAPPRKAIGSRGSARGSFRRVVRCCATRGRPGSSSRDASRAR
jgi:AcrR family transcriptional regulator